jgi:hypothetical protein
VLNGQDRFLEWRKKEMKDTSSGRDVSVLANNGFEYLYR